MLSSVRPWTVGLATLAVAACAPAASIATVAPSVTATLPTEPPTVTTAIPTRSPEPGFTLLPAALPPVSTPTTEPCVNDAVFVSDLTIPDLTQFLPGAPLDKMWQIRNEGTCTWGPDYRVVFVEGNALGAASEHALYPARPSAEAVVRIQMTAPDQPGEYQGNWRLRDPQGNLFGHILFIKIAVIPLPQPEAGTG